MGKESCELNLLSGNIQPGVFVQDCQGRIGAVIDMQGPQASVIFPGKDHWIGDLAQIKLLYPGKHSIQETLLSYIIWKVGSSFQSCSSAFWRVEFGMDQKRFEQRNAKGKPQTTF